MIFTLITMTIALMINNQHCLQIDNCYPIQSLGEDFNDHSAARNPRVLIAFLQPDDAIQRNHHVLLRMRFRALETQITAMQASNQSKNKGYQLFTDISSIAIKLEREAQRIDSTSAVNQFFCCDLISEFNSEKV